MSNATTDAFGVEAKVLSPELADMDLPAEERKAPPQGLPLIAKIGIGVFGLIVSGLILTVFITRLPKSAAPANRPPAAEVDSGFQQAMRGEVAQLKATLAAVQDSQQQLRADLAKAAAKPPEVQLIERRLAEMEGSLQSLGAGMKIMAKRVANQQPLDVDLMRREDARIVSVGNGVARIVDAVGKEVALQKGDRWNGLVVREIRSDRRTVLLSDGSVIL